MEVPRPIIGLGGIQYFTIYQYGSTGRFVFLLYLLYRYLNVWFVKCDTPCVISNFIVYFHLFPLFLSMPLSTQTSPRPLSLKERILMFLNHETVAFSLHGQCSNVDDNDVVFTLLLNINPLAFHNTFYYICKQLVFTFLVIGSNSC